MNQTIEPSALRNEVTVAKMQWISQKKSRNSFTQARYKYSNF